MYARKTLLLLALCMAMSSCSMFGADPYDSKQCTSSMSGISCDGSFEVDARTNEIVLHLENVAPSEVSIATVEASGDGHCGWIERWTIAKAQNDATQGPNNIGPYKAFRVTISCSDDVERDEGFEETFTLRPTYDASGRFAHVIQLTAR